MDVEPETVHFSRERHRRKAGLGRPEPDLRRTADHRLPRLSVPIGSAQRPSILRHQERVQNAAAE